MKNLIKIIAFTIISYSAQAEINGNVMFSGKVTKLDNKNVYLLVNGKKMIVPRTAISKKRSGLRTGQRVIVRLDHKLFAKQYSKAK